jgi:hypothetical protein
MAVKQSTLFFGCLEAGGKSSLVVKDDRLGTGTTSTIYLFNLSKGKILEYRRDIVEAKLRDLTDEEQSSLGELLEAFERARKGFVPRAARRTFSEPAPRAKRQKQVLPDAEFEEGDEPYFLDEDGGDREAPILDDR